MAKTASGMTDKQEAFVREYMVDMNATQAAIRAGYSANTARAIGHENLTKPYIREAIAAAIGERAERTQVSQDAVVDGLVTEATDRGKGSRHSARVSAWGLLGKHLGMFVERVAGADGGPIRHEITVTRKVVGADQS